MQAQIIICLSPLLPALLCFLNAVFTEYAMASLQYSSNALVRLAFADSHKSWMYVAAGTVACRLHLRAHPGQIFFDGRGGCASGCRFHGAHPLHFQAGPMQP